ncbi:uncharacterized protein LOC110976752 isoform X2 [Acanthaster planci]|uniref:Uncharacterized protein LOC110976752 isoform X2 n=1 Tax=Acanthaster planci TaxID=133434 RepID=A0A8B7Y246_ACAPL|nr:uncharacterized protein LOC110976752 isoform X2 [Acanthaster planci]
MLHGRDDSYSMSHPWSSHTHRPAVQVFLCPAEPTPMNREHCKTVTWKDEFSGPFCWETKCQQELTILTPETISAASVPSPSISHDLIKVSDPEVETDAEWFAKSNKDKSKLSVMLMRDVSNRSSLGNNLLASSSERLAFDQAVNAALASKPKPKEKPATNGHSNGERKSSQGSLDGRKRNATPEPSEKNKAAPPISLRQKSGSKSSLNKELDRKMGSGGKGKDKTSYPSSPRRDSGSKGSEPTSPRRDSGSKGIGMGSPRRDSGSKKTEKKQLLPPGFLTELEQELKVQDNVNFNLGVQQEKGQGDAVAGESPKIKEGSSYEFLFDW